MLRISLIGPGDIDFHYFQMLKISREDFDMQIGDIAEALKESEIVLLPDKGVSFELARKYKELGGKKVYATMPLNDKDFGIMHLKPYIDSKVYDKNLFDEIINTDNWYKQDLMCAIYGDVVLMLGNSLGSIGELSNGFYLYRLFSKFKLDWKEIRAGTKVPFSVIIYQPFFKEKLNFEIEEYIKKSKGEIYYVSSAEEINKILDKISLR